VTAQRVPSQLDPARATSVVVYVTLLFVLGSLTFELTVEHVPFVPVTHERVVVVPPVTAKVTVAPATG
jgi:hypothetical protein